MMCSRVGSVLDAILGPMMDEYVRNAPLVGLMQDLSRSYPQRHHDISLLEVLRDGAGSSKALRFEGPNSILNSLLRGPADDNEGHTAFVPTLRVFLKVWWRLPCGRSGVRTAYSGSAARRECTWHSRP